MEHCKFSDSKMIELMNPFTYGLKQSGAATVDKGIKLILLRTH